MVFFRFRLAPCAGFLAGIFVLNIVSVFFMSARADEAGMLSLREAIAATLRHNPQLTSFQFREQSLAGDLQTAGLTPVVRLSAEAENIAGSGVYQGVESAELTLALSSVIELGDKRNARLGVVTERQQALAVEQKIVELDLLAEVTRRYIKVAETQQHLALRRSALALATETTVAIKQRVEIGNTPDAELARALANQARMAIEVKAAEGEFAAAKVNLSSLWAVDEQAAITPSFSAVSADLFNLGATHPLGDLLKGLADNPDILLFASEARMRDAQLRLALSERTSDLEWSAGVRRLHASKDSALVLGVSVPLFGGSRASGEIAAAKANRSAVDTERNAAMIRLRAQVFTLYQQRQVAVFAANSLRDQVIPQLKHAVAGTRRAFDKGRYGYLELSSAQHELLEAESALIAAAARAHVWRVEIERLTGASTYLDKNFQTPAKEAAQ